MIQELFFAPTIFNSGYIFPPLQIRDKIMLAYYYSALNTDCCLTGSQQDHNKTKIQGCSSGHNKSHARFTGEKNLWNNLK